MTVTAADLDTKYSAQIIGKRNTSYAKQEIISLLADDPDEENTWSELIIFEQARLITRKCE